MTDKYDKGDAYKMRPVEDLEPHYSRHVAAMTREKLHSKSAIAAELACRDWKIERLIENEQATLKTIETIQVIRMADEAEIERLTAEVKSAFFAGCDYGSKYACDQYLGTPERQRGFDQWKPVSGSPTSDYITGLRVILGRGDKRVCAGEIDGVPALLISDEPGTGEIGEDLGDADIPSGKEIVAIIFEDEAALDVLINQANHAKARFTDDSKQEINAQDAVCRAAQEYYGRLDQESLDVLGVALGELWPHEDTETADDSRQTESKE